MTYAFYVVDLCERIGYQWAFFMFVCFGSVLAFLPIVALMWKGEDWRRKLGEPGGTRPALDSTPRDIGSDDKMKDGKGDGV